MSTFMMCKVGLVLVVLIFALYYDLRENKIKNFVTLPAAIAGLVLNSAQEGWMGFWAALQGWLIPTLLLFILYYINVMGAGDIKLFAALGSIMGVPFALESFAYTTFIGGIIAMVLLLVRGQFVASMSRLVRYFQLLMWAGKLYPYSAKDDTGSKFAFTTAIVPGTLFQLFFTLTRM